MFKYIKEVADIRKLKKYVQTKFKAADAELEEVKKGNYNYKGIEEEK